MGGWIGGWWRRGRVGLCVCVVGALGPGEVCLCFESFYADVTRLLSGFVGAGDVRVKRERERHMTSFCFSISFSLLEVRDWP